MRLNHLDLPVPDFAATAAYFRDHFGFHIVHSGDAMAILQGEDGFVLVVNQLHAEGSRTFPRSFHIGFMQPSHAAVHAAAARLRASGLAVPEPQQEYGATVLFLHAPGDILIEIAHRPARA